AAVDDPKAFDALFAQVHTTTDRRQEADLIAALTGTHDAARLARVLPLALDASIEWQLVAFLPGGAAPDPALRTLGATYGRDHLTELEARVPEVARANFAYMVTSDCDPTTRDAAVAAAETLRGFPGGPRAVTQSIERLD